MVLIIVKILLCFQQWKYLDILGVLRKEIKFWSGSHRKLTFWKNHFKIVGKTFFFLQSLVRKVIIIPDQLNNCWMAMNFYNIFIMCSFYSPFGKEVFHHTKHTHTQRHLIRSIFYLGIWPRWMTNQDKQPFVWNSALIYVTKSLVRVISVKQHDIICLHGMRPELLLFS